MRGPFLFIGKVLRLSAANLVIFSGTLDDIFGALLHHLFAFIVEFLFEVLRESSNHNNLLTHLLDDLFEVLGNRDCCASLATTGAVD